MIRNIKRARGYALVLLIALGLPGAAQGLLLEVGASGTTNLADVNSIQPAVSTTLDIAFSTDDTDNPGSSCVSSGVDPGCVFGWFGDLTATGSLRIIDYEPGPNAASGSASTTCDPSFLPSTTCRTNGGDFSGENGTNLLMFSITVSGGSIGDQLLWADDFTEGDFSTTQVNQVLAQVVPEPGSALMLVCGLVGLGLVYMRSD